MELWFEEKLDVKEGRVMRLRVDRTLETIQTPFQRIDVFETPAFGRMFTLDDVIMVTEKDEFSYHEMIAHVPMMTHPSPERVLVIGGGDGGTVREVLKHKTVKEVHLCEIDKGVVDIAYKYFPEISNAMKDSRVKHFYEDGAAFVENHKGYYDVILVDSSDPIGPAEILFKRPFYEGLRNALRETGVVATQAESYQYHGDIIKGLYKFIPEVFEEYGYYWTAIPTYPSGLIGFTLLSNKIDPYSVEPDPTRIPEGLKYYSKDIHKACMVLPKFASEYIPKKRK
ncbi:MAG: polyamine aminopropyltransferase [Leptospiraceae bacterium]|nr:polyamine aminopropyltransferase [Leptospiraceae bacterium]MCP5502485.1 polyamine aminopropyltransferase [Leptospiraceae bacterium]